MLCRKKKYIYIHGFKKTKIIYHVLILIRIFLDHIFSEFKINIHPMPFVLFCFALLFCDYTLHCTKKWANTKWDGENLDCVLFICSYAVYTAEAAVGASYVVISLSICQKNKTKFDLIESKTCCLKNYISLDKWCPFLLCR